MEKSPSTSVSPIRGIIEPGLLDLFKDSIRRIKNQKQRPSFDRIAQTLKTHHDQADRLKIKSNLYFAIRDGLLLPVWTKGQECYKDPENLKSLRKFQVQTPADIRRAVKAAVREIGDPLGSKVTTITNYVRYSFSIRTPNDLDAGVLSAVAILTGKGDLIKVAERYRSCHIAASDSSTQHNGCDSASTLLDAEEEDDSDEMVPTTSSSSSRRSLNLEPAPSSSGNATSNNSLTKSALPSSGGKNGNDEVSTADRGKLTAVLKKTPKPEEGKQQVRRFLRFQCWCCRFFTVSEQDLIKHVSGQSHEERTRKRIIYCNTCCFRTRNRSKLVDHLKRHSCHTDRTDVSPACLLTFGIFTSFTLTD
ncbi:hypothetical protein BV898_14669 [Hypsibius exemplaris]|uniref:SAMD1-like winged helix (WH) domain-containing protein n=1 Tax=Hypsibius exemplaris TaxID=2072580 RepID=A0A9X6NAN8_HYPEX|nr:hypothetical protein BV898_14669 [Hypsibius exemplaris]